MAGVRPSSVLTHWRGPLASKVIEDDLRAREAAQPTSKCEPQEAWIVDCVDQKGKRHIIDRSSIGISTSPIDCHNAAGCSAFYCRNPALPLTMTPVQRRWLRSRDSDHARRL